MARNDYEKTMNQLLGMWDTHVEAMTTHINDLETHTKELLGGLIRELDRERAARVKAQAMLKAHLVTVRCLYRDDGSMIPGEFVWCKVCNAKGTSQNHTKGCVLDAALKEPA